MSVLLNYMYVISDLELLKFKSVILVCYDLNVLMNVTLQCKNEMYVILPY